MRFVLMIIIMYQDNTFTLSHEVVREGQCLAEIEEAKGQPKIVLCKPLEHSI